MSLEFKNDMVGILKHVKKDMVFKYLYNQDVGLKIHDGRLAVFTAISEDINQLEMMMYRAMDSLQIFPKYDCEYDFEQYDTVHDCKGNEIPLYTLIVSISDLDLRQG